MLGRFLELSVRTPDIRASLDFYDRLGFSAAEVGEVWPHPYAVVTDGRIYVGLHQTPQLETPGLPEAAITFVRPDLLGALDAFERMGVEFEFRRLGNDVFNEVGWLDPSGNLIRLVEARTFSPSKRGALENSACGHFLEIGLPEAHLETSKAYWEELGFVGMDEPDARLPHVCCTSDTIDVGLYDRDELRRLTLLFDTDDPEGCILRLGQRGIEPIDGLPATLHGGLAALFVAPEGTPIIIASFSDTAGFDTAGS
jgi:catechol 2,3-dioxygenase-like lactoylglutathione lyase family enzyme